MPKLCQCPKCNNYVFSGGYCAGHQYMKPDYKPYKPPPQKPIAKSSDKTKKLLDDYHDQRLVFLAKNPLCKAKCCEECTKQATEVHHMKGRGEFLLDEQTWLPVCRYCHQWIEVHPALAKLLNLSQSRLN